MNEGARNFLLNLDIFSHCLLVRIRLAFTPFKKWINFKACKTRITLQDSLDIDEINKKIFLSNNIIGFNSCLKSSICLHEYLLKRGISNQLVIGVKKNSDGVFDSHAWVEVQKIKYDKSNTASSYKVLYIKE